MKRILIMFFLSLAIVTGCTSNDNNNIENDTNKPDTIIEPQDETQDEDANAGIDANSDTAQLAIGLEAPDFTLINLEGEEVSLSDFRDKIILINFWASWCKYCDLEMPDLNNLHNENDDVIVLAVNVQESEDVVRDYIEKNELDFEVVLDSDGAIARQYSTSGLPNSYFVNPQGIFMGRFPGMMTAEQMSEVINNIRNLHE